MTNPLSSDQAVYVEWVAGDAGVHTQVNTVWWLSPDVQITGPLTNQAQPGVTSTVECRAHAKAGVPINGATVLMEVFISKPSVSLAPPPGSVNIGTVAVSAAGLGPTGATQTFTWTPAATEPTGHRCLVLRAFPDSFFPASTTSFFFETNDPHIAQHNIDIVLAVRGGDPPPGFLAPDEEGLWQVPLGFVNPAEETAVVGILVDRDLRPDIDLLFPAFTKQIGEFVPEQAAELPPVRFTFPEGITALPWQGIRPGTRFPDGIRLGPGDRLGGTAIEPGLDVGGQVIAVGDVVGGRPVEKGSALIGFAIPQGAVVGARGALTLRRPLRGFRRTRWAQLNALKWANVGNVRAKLAGGQAETFHLGVDLRATPKGASQVYHLQQVDEQGNPQGGLTLIVVKTD